MGREEEQKNRRGLEHYLTNPTKLYEAVAVHSSMVDGFSMYPLNAFNHSAPMAPRSAKNLNVRPDTASSKRKRKIVVP